jgi:RNA recognition motif-containing protein
MSRSEATHEVLKKEKRTKKEKRHKSSQVVVEPAEQDVSDTALKVAKREKRVKKEKKIKPKAKSDDDDEDEDEDVNVDVDMENGSEDEAADEPSSSKKRKRETLPDELEIDISLPEPASKKAARKAKKAKSAPTTTDGIELAEKPAIADTAGKRSEHGVWIGNLPWSATRDLLITFLTSNSDITTADITRVHLPPPTKPCPPSWTTKPLNKGFAYVDFSTQLAMYSAIALTETKMDGRALLIKNANSFEGRPEKPKPEEVGPDGKVKPAGHAPNKRVFVGNLAFDVSKEDLQTHYSQCGEILDIHMATFEDSGKCKGYAWITFEDVEAATGAVRGYIFKDEKDIKKKEKKDGEDSDTEKQDAKKKKKSKIEKKRKWHVNQLMGRDLRAEFAEDSTVRYNKRHKKKTDPTEFEGMNPARFKALDEEVQGERPPRKNRPFVPRPKVDARTIPSGKAHTNAPRASHAIVEATGTKKTFD